MFAILGAAGKAGYATATALRAAGKPVRAILRDPSKAERLAALGCEIAIAVLHDTGALLRAFEGAAAVQVICPTAPRAQNAAGEMHHSIKSVGLALEVVKPEAVLAISDYGAEIEEGTGITLLFHALESRLRRLPSRLILLRSAEHMENWARVIGPAAETGALPSLHHPVGKIFPTVSARDVGGIAADLLMESTSDHISPRIVHAEGPNRYTSSDVAQALATLLHRDVAAYELPRNEWHATLLRAGTSESAAYLVTELYDAHNAGRIDAEPGVGEIRRGRIQLEDALRPLVR